MSIRKLLMVLIGVVFFITLTHELELHLGDLEQEIQRLGFWAPVGFIAVFVLCTPVWVSVDVLCFVAGLLFPILPAEFYMTIATYLAASLIFFLGRYWFRSKVSAFIDRQQKLSGINKAISRDAFRLMFLLRLTPLPFALLSYAFAVAPVRFWPYLAATSGILFYNATLVYLGFTAKHLSSLASGETLPPPIPYPLLAVGLVIAVFVIRYITKIATQATNDIDTKSTGIKID